MTNHTAMVTSRNKLRSIYIPRIKPKQRLWLKSRSLHFLVSFVWRNVHRFVLRSKTHNRYKIGQHNMIATNIFYLFSTRFSNQTLGFVLRNLFSHLRSSTSLLNKTSLAFKSTFKHSNSLSFSRECSARFL